MGRNHCMDCGHPMGCRPTMFGYCAHGHRRSASAPRLPGRVPGSDKSMWPPALPPLRLALQARACEGRPYVAPGRYPEAGPMFRAGGGAVIEAPDAVNELVCRGAGARHAAHLARLWNRSGSAGPAMSRPTKGIDKGRAAPWPLAGNADRMKYLLPRPEDHPDLEGPAVRRGLQHLDVSGGGYCTDGHGRVRPVRPHSRRRAPCGAWAARPSGARETPERQRTNGVRSVRRARAARRRRPSGACALRATGAGWERF